MMIKNAFICTVILAAFLPFHDIHAQEKNDSTSLFYFIKKELNTGVFFSYNTEREELRHEKFRNYEELSRFLPGFRFGNRNWSYLPFRQETWSYLLEAGPFLGKGEFTDSSDIQIIESNQELTGLRGNFHANYSSRFYFDQKNYTLVGLDAWGSYELFRKNADGLLTDSNQVTLPYDKTSEHSRFRYGFRARAGWGVGRLTPMNHYMAAAWLLGKHYPGRLFSEKEVSSVAWEIGRIKHQRNVRSGHSAGKEAEHLAGFLNSQLLLITPQNAGPDWELTEFRPRFEGSRMELGPFFNYFNREPDFVYGGYFKFENHKYCTLNRNRNLSAILSYNGYKRKDWITLETSLEWSFYPNIKTEYGFGVKYIPGMMVDGFDDIGQVRHNFVPYLEYFCQVSSKYRIETGLAWRIAPNDQFMLPGPEVLVSFYRSRY